MPERDAFGNEIPPAAPKTTPASARPAASARPRASERPTASARPMVTASPTASASPMVPPTVVGKRRTPGVAGIAGGGCILAVILIAVAGVVVAGLVGSTVNSGVETFRSISSAFPATVSAPRRELPAAPGIEVPTTTSDAPATKRPARPPAGVAGTSLVRRRNFAAAVTRLRRSGLGRPTSLRVAPDRIDAQLLTRGGRLRSVQVQPGGGLMTSSSSGAGFGGQRTLSLAAIDRAAPERLARAAAKRLGRSVKGVDYLVLLEFSGSPRWAVYLKGGRAFLGDAHGRIVQKIS